MSCNYADGLSPYEDKGKLGIPERFESAEKVAEKATLLAQWIKEASHVVLHTGAGISTASGIPDFRGPKGVWTLEKKGERPNINVSFDDAVPTFTHMAILALARAGHVHYVVSQNIDGLHLKSGLDRSKLSELHGNMFIEQCSQCSRQFVRHQSVPTVGQRCLNKPCPAMKGSNGALRLPCRGKLHDTVLDWEHELPTRDLSLAELHSSASSLSLCLGTTLQIVPSGNLPLLAKKNGGKLVICNLQPTKHDKKADLTINTYVDDVLRILLEKLQVTPIQYSANADPTKNPSVAPKEWTLTARCVGITRKRLETQGLLKPTGKEKETTKTKKEVKSEEPADQKKRRRSEGTENDQRPSPSEAAAINDVAIKTEVEPDQKLEKEINQDMVVSSVLTTVMVNPSPPIV